MKKRNQPGNNGLTGVMPADADLKDEETRVSHATSCGDGIKNGHEPKQTRKYVSWAHGLYFVLGIAAALFTQSLLSKPRYDIMPLPLKDTLSPKPASYRSLECTTIELERPDETLAGMPDFNPVVRWRFDNKNEGQLTELFQDPDIPKSVADRLLDKSRWQNIPRGVVVSPDETTVLGLGASARKTIYRVLGQSPANTSQCNPIRIESEKVDAWVKSSGLSETNQALFRKLLYPDGKDLLFADFETIAARCGVEERKRFGKASSRVEALVASLRITPETDIDALVRYWGKWEGGQQVIPFVQALSAVPGGASVNVSYFFPPFARLRLYKYPQNPTNTVSMHEDCFWTAMNFFNEKPDNRFCDPAFILETLRNDYTQVSGERSFGDVLLIMENGVRAVHMCVYVAEDVVFTKNGVHALQPWVLMRMREMMRLYSGDERIQVRCYRRKSLG